MRLLSRWNGLRVKIIAWSFIPSVLILTIVAVVTFFAYQQVTEDLVIERDQELTRLAAGQLANEMRAYTDLLTSITRSNALQSRIPLAQQGALETFRNPLTIFDGGVIVLDTHGIVRAALPEQRRIIGEDWSDRSYFRSLLRSPRPHFSNITPDGPDGAEVVAAVVPIYGSQGEVTGTLVGMFRIGASSISAFYGGIVKQRIGESGTTYIVDENGRVVYHTDAARIGDDFSGLPVLERLQSGASGAVRTRDFAGQEIVAGYSPISGTSWGLVTEEKWSVLLSRSRPYQQFLLVLLALGVILPTAMVMVGVRRIMQPVEDLIDAAQEVAQGNFDRTITAKTGDEIEILAGRFNWMTGQIRDSYRQLEQRVADRTKELEALFSVQQAIIRRLDPDAVLQMIVDEARRLTGARGAMVFLLIGDRLRLGVVSNPFPGLQYPIGREIPLAGSFAERTIRERKPVCVDDIRLAPEAQSNPERRKFAEDAGIVSLAIVPMLSNAEPYGAIMISDDRPGAFGAEAERTLSLLASSAMVGLENARLYQAQQERRRVAEGLRDILAILNSSLPLVEVLEAIVNQARQLLGAEAGVVYRFSLEDATIYVEAAAGMPESFSAFDTLPFYETLPNLALLNRQPYAVSNFGPYVDQNYSEQVEAFPENLRNWVDVVRRHFSAYLAVPLIVQGAVYGMISLYYTEAQEFGEEVISLGMTFADQAALAIENARLRIQVEQSAVLTERNRLARELHDAVTQTLFSASLIAEVLPRIWERNPEEGQRRLRELRQMTRGALAEMRTLLLELRPTALLEADTVELFRHLTNAFTGRTQVPVRLLLDLQTTLAPEQKVVFYRISQEALNNVAKHAAASEVVLNLSGWDGEIELVITDNGRGFDPKSVPPDHLGLGIMRERAESIGATFEISSAPGEGTTIQARWVQPVPQQA